MNSHPHTIHHRTRRRRHPGGFTLVEMLLALAIAAMLGAAIAVALNASLIAYATSAELTSTQTSTRMVMQRLLSLIRTSRLHDPYDPDDPYVMLLDPADANHPLQCVGIQMRLPDDRHIRVWWEENTIYNEAYVGDMWYEDTSNPTQGRQLILARLEAQRTEMGDPYIFTMGSRRSETGLLLARASVDLMVHPNPVTAMTLESAKARTSPLRLVGSTMPRKNVE
jgi:prepilin-type N-terminal cleavage/methylation domain-containing protein